MAFRAVRFWVALAVAVVGAMAALPVAADWRWTKLHEGAARNDVEVIKLWIELGADVKAKSSDGRTPLHVAVSKGSREAAAVLIEAGADVNEEYGGLTPLHWAGKDVAALLIEHGAEVDAKNKDGETPLHRAWKDKAALLIEAGADVHAKDNRGETPLHRAAYSWGGVRSKRNIYIAEFLIAKGADVNAKDNRGEMPLHRAAGKYGTNDSSRVAKVYKEMVILLVEHGAEIDVKMIAWAARSSPQGIDIDLSLWLKARMEGSVEAFPADEQSSDSVSERGTESDKPKRRSADDVIESVTGRRTEEAKNAPERGTESGKPKRRSADDVIESITGRRTEESKKAPERRTEEAEEQSPPNPIGELIENSSEIINLFDKLLRPK